MNPNGYDIAVTLDTPARKEYALKVVSKLPVLDKEPYRISCKRKRADKSREQENHYHALIDDIANQYEHAGRRWGAEDMKRLLVDAFWHDTKDDEELKEAWQRMGEHKIVPAMGRDGFVVLGFQTRRFPKKLAMAFITWLYAFGSDNGVQWSQQENWQA